MNLTSTWPTSGMRSLDIDNNMLDNIKVGEDSVCELALVRGGVVREYWTAHRLPSKRIFLGAEDVAPVAPTWKPQAELRVVAD